MLRITASDYELLLKTRQALRENELPSALVPVSQEFCSYVDRLETEREEDKAKQRDRLKKWRTSPSGREKYREINARNMRTYRAKKKALKAAQEASEEN